MKVFIIGSSVIYPIYDFQSIKAGHLFRYPQWIRSDKKTEIYKLRKGQSVIVSYEYSNTKGIYYQMAHIHKEFVKGEFFFDEENKQVINNLTRRQQIWKEKT